MIIYHAWEPFQFAGGKGCQVVISGKLTGQRHRTEKFKEGYIKFCGEPRLKFIKVGFAVAKLKPGVIGMLNPPYP